MTTTIYQSYRRKGYTASRALQAARVTRRFQRLEALGLVRLHWEPDYERQWDVCSDNPAETQRWQAELRRAADREGVWGLIAEYNVGRTWVEADAIWGMIGQDGRGYEVDIMSACITEMRRANRARCRCCMGTGQR